MKCQGQATEGAQASVGYRALHFITVLLSLSPKGCWMQSFETCSGLPELKRTSGVMGAAHSKTAMCQQEGHHRHQSAQ